MSHPYVIAEAGSNHDGRFEQACRLVYEAFSAGADAVKFQCLPNLPREWLPELKALAADLGIDLFASVFDFDAVEFLADLGVPYLKIASPELVNLPLIRVAADTDIPLILSTGMATLVEINEAIEAAGPVEMALLQCATAYPAQPALVNLRAMQTLRAHFFRRVGLSDHTLGITVPIAAAALGAEIIEKHLTLDRGLEGPDHPFALEPSELAAMVAAIREVEQALGDGRKDGPREGEMAQLRGRRLQWQT